MARRLTRRRQSTNRGPSADSGTGIRRKSVASIGSARSDVSHSTETPPRRGPSRHSGPIRGPRGSSRPSRNALRRLREPSSPFESEPIGTDSVPRKRCFAHGLIVKARKPWPPPSRPASLSSRTEPLECATCARTFASGRALTQHRRFVHEGARLFGYTLAEPESTETGGADESGEPTDAPDVDAPDSEEDPEPGSEPSGRGVDAILLLLTIAAVGIVGAYLRSSSVGPQAPERAGPMAMPSRFTPYGPRPAGWAWAR